MWTNCLRMELAPFGICTSAIEPGLFQTSIFTVSKIFINSISDNQDREILNAYNWNNVKDSIIDRNTQFENSGDINLDPVLNKITHALTAKYPQRNYIVNQNFTSWLFSNIPLWLLEWIASK